MNVPWIKLLRQGLIAVAYSCFIGTAGAQGLDAIYTQQSSGDIDNINTTTGVSTTLATEAAENWNGAAYDPDNGLVYISDLGPNNPGPGTIITNTIYSFNPFNPGGGVTEVGTIAGQAAFTGAAYYNGLYYVIPGGTDQLIAYSFAGGTITQVSSQTLGGLGTTELWLGDIAFIGSTIYISAGSVTGTTISTTYTLYKYANVNNVTTPVYAVNEGAEVGVGIGYDVNSGTLIMFNNDGTIETVDPTTGAESDSITLTGPAASGGAGDFTIVPEPGTYALWSLMLLFALVAFHRTFRPKLQTCSI